MPTQFGHLKKNYAPREKTWFLLPIEGRAKLLLSHAGQSNKPYTTAVMKDNAKTGASRKIAQGRIDVNLLEDSLQLDRDLFPRFVVNDWENVLDDKGKPVKFTCETCHEFLCALPDWIMQEVTAYASRATNFLPDDMPSNEEVDAQAGK